MNKPTIIDFLNTRSERQKINNLLAYNSIVKSVLTKKTINVEELNRVLNELQLYLARFTRDVDDHFRFWTFMKYEWYYPFRSKIYLKIRKLVLLPIRLELLKTKSTWLIFL